MERTRKVRDGLWRSFLCRQAERGYCAKISDEKDDPVWMREFRMKSLQIYRQMQIPDWGPPIDGLDSMIVSGFADDVSKELPDF